MDLPLSHTKKKRLPTKIGRVRKTTYGCWRYTAIVVQEYTHTNLPLGGTLFKPAKRGSMTSGKQTNTEPNSSAKTIKNKKAFASYWRPKVGSCASSQMRVPSQPHSRHSAQNTRTREVRQGPCGIRECIETNHGFPVCSDNVTVEACLPEGGRSWGPARGRTPGAS